MASQSDGSGAPGITFSSMKQPPLIKQLKGILSEYPDGGQILKEVIQNAEDGEASKVNILYDGRRINDTPSETTLPYDRFFKGPALCIYNDGIFKEKDWDGIRMIYSSVKEDDPLTVGRFGLGFKSVFHLTDFPCVISGGKMLLIDPQQPSDKVNAMIDLSRIDHLENEGLKAESLWSALDETFGFNRECARSGYFNGTIFWFPLREKPSEISDTLYDKEKVMDLFDGFQSEASSILLFLKNLTRISIAIRENDSKVKEIASTEVDDTAGKLKQSRSKFKEKILLLSKDYKDEDVCVDMQVTVKTTIGSSSETMTWLVVNYFVGNSASPEFKKLIQNESLGYSPYVGVAAPVSNPQNTFEGHVFCFLPLPREGSGLTGLSIHVNGFFALSQNRHHLKWETDEQRGKKIDDKSILWNKTLIKEALPKAYSRLIQSMIQVSTTLGNNEDSVAAVYRCLPSGSKIQNKWKILETEFYKKAKKSKLLYSKHKCKWVTISDACFASFDDLPDEYKHTKAAVTKCLSCLGQSHVELPNSILNSLKRHFNNVKNLTPGALAKILQQNLAYRNLSNQHRLELLTYLFSDKRYYEKVDGLELIPLASGGWGKFKAQQNPIYFCEDIEIDLLLGSEQILIRKPSDLGKTLAMDLDQISKTGLFQIRKLDHTIFQELLEYTIETKSQEKFRITNSSHLSFSWLQNIWVYIIKNDIVSQVKDVHIVPILTKGTWVNPEVIHLAKPAAKLLVKSSLRDQLPDGVCRCFESVGVKVVCSLPDWIPKEKVKSHFFWPTQKGFMSLLTKFGSESNNLTIERFNTSCTYEDKADFLACLAKCHHSLTDEAVEFVKSLQLFRGITSMNVKGVMSSVSGTSCFVKKDIQFPDGLQFPFCCIEADPSNEPLLLQMGAREISLEELVLSTLEKFQKTGFQNMNEIPKFMDYFIKQFSLFQTCEDIISAVSNVPFLKVGTKRCKAADLFDPSDVLLHDLLTGDNLLPETKKRLKSEQIRILKFLGLKSIDNITADVIFQVARTLDIWSREGCDRGVCLRKANALMQILHQRDHFLRQKCQNGYTLSQNLRNLSCIPAQNKRVSYYPKCLPWFSEEIILCKPTEAKETSQGLFVGAICPIIDCSSETLNTEYGWNSKPTLQNVMMQLKIVRESYSVENRPEILPLIQQIYSHLTQRHQEISNYTKTNPVENLVWNGDAFVAPTKVIISKSNSDLDLMPYFWFLPPEFIKMKSLFSAFGCPDAQNHFILLDTLNEIKYFHSITRDEQRVTHDRNIVCNILDKIASMIDHKQLSIENLDMLIMVQDNDNQNSIQLFPISECVYDDDPTVYFETTEGVYLVHELISRNIVEALGIKSVSRKALMDAEEIGVEEWGQQEPLTTRIHALLRDGYTDGLSVPKELIQNADDAGANVIKFLYDERQNTDYRQRVFSREMRAFQGPALWVYNDAQFSKQDLKNITKLNAATKQDDVRKIGKFGLGFCSVYNLTDMPSFLSGSNMVFFDPHEKHIKSVLRGRGTGLKYNLPNKNLISRHKDQFIPYSGVFGCDIENENFESYDGTLFRIPLRTEKQANESKICNVPYTEDEMKTLLKMFMETAGNCLIFTQSLTQLEIYHLPENASSVSEQKLIYKIHKDSVKLNGDFESHINESVLSRMPEICKQQKHFIEIHKSVICQSRSDSAKAFIGKSEYSRQSSCTWITCWATGIKNSHNIYHKLASQGSIPLSAVSVPCIERDEPHILELLNAPEGFYKEGHVFCFLPLPLETKLPFHINGCFAVTSDRKQLATLTEDDKNSKGNVWNDALMEDSIAVAQLQLLMVLTTFDATAQNDCKKYYTLWPSICGDSVLPFKNGFYKAVVDSNFKVFRGNDEWVSFHESTFLHSDISESAFGELAYEILTNFPPRNERVLIRMPAFIIENILQCNKSDRSIILSGQICEEEFFLTFLKTLNTDFWNSRLDQRNMLILAALNSKCDGVARKMQNLRCIPTMPANLLCKASDLIHPQSSIASLFSDDEEVFPISNVEFRKHNILSKLVSLGMANNLLTSKRLLERCRSILNLAEHCTGCAKERENNLMCYLTQDHVLNELEKDAKALQKLSEEYILPVLSKPKKWSFSWKSELDKTDIKRYNGLNNCNKHRHTETALQLGKPKCLFRQDAKDYVGLVELLINEEEFNFRTEFRKVKRLLKCLKVRGVGDISIEVLVRQLHTVIEEYNDNSKQFSDILRIHETIFSHLEKKLVQSELTEREREALQSLGAIPSVLIGNELVPAKSVALNVKEEYKPYLYKLPDVDKIKRKTVYEVLGVQEYFSLEVVIEVMRLVRNDESVQNLETINNLLINLDEVMQRTKVTYEDMGDLREDIIAPDTTGKLWPTYMLVEENTSFRTSSTMKILHMSVSPSLAQRLGVKIKRMQCIKDIRVGISFGQREELVTRIKGLLKAYPFDSSIMKEFLQNADDAGATEIHFVKDYRTHAKDKIFDPSCELLQGPSLCVYNNSYFTDKDIEGIHNLGQGSKGNDPTKTGQYGVGFNACYHLTDTPSFVSIGPNIENERLMFILDPLCKYVPLAIPSEPGMMCKIQDLTANFNDHIEGFSLNQLVLHDVGTVFRFPLRCKASDISNEEISEDKMDQILQDFQNDMFECVLFLKHITSIKILNITSGKLIEEYAVQVELTEEADKKRRLFNEIVNQTTAQNRDSREKLLEIQPHETIYRLSVLDSRDHKKDWIVVQRFGACGPIDKVDEIKDNLKNGDIGFLPLGGVAVPLRKTLVSNISNSTAECHGNTTNSYSDVKVEDQATVRSSERLVQGKLFCFLPLPITTGLPVHVNGHFALDHEARRDLWKDGYRNRWNTCLVNNIIIPAWISGLYHLRDMITPVMKRARKWQRINSVLADFHTYFPVKSCTTDFWKQLAWQFYKYIVREHVAVFACVEDDTSIDRISRPERFSISWVIVATSKDSIFDGIFNTVLSVFSSKQPMLKQHQVNVVVSILKAIGMKIVETPLEIKHAIEKAKIESVLTSGPSEIISFMKANDNFGKMVHERIPVGKPISETKYSSAENLRLLLQYLSYINDFHSHLENLPILLTADGIVRVCSSEAPIFLSEYSKLLPKSAHLFVYEQIRFVYPNPKIYETTILKELCFEDFVRLLPESIDINVYSSDSTIILQEDADTSVVTTPRVSKEWLTLFYDFLYECSCKTEADQTKPYTYKTSIDTDILLQNIKALEKWSFLPCQQFTGNQILVPLSETKHLLHISYNDSISDVGRSLNKFHLPKLYKGAFSNCKPKDEVQKAFKSIIASLDRPYDLLLCLVFHKDKVQSTEKKLEDGINILAFFGQKLAVLAKHEEKDGICKLFRQLPLFVTQQGTMQDISGAKEVMVLPKGMPFAGIQTWADACSITLLQESDSLKSIYDFLGLQNADIDFVYGNRILPTFNAIPKEHWMHHIEHLRDRIGHKTSLTADQSKIIKVLTKTAFINIDGDMKRTNELFDPSKRVFKCMVESNACLPDTFNTPDWHPLLTKLGLKCNVTDDLMLQFAKQIESNSEHTSKHIREKSKVLLSRFIKNRGTEWQSQTITQIKSIRFIEPFTTKRQNIEVCQQYANKDSFICFQESVEAAEEQLCWSTVNLLSSSVHYDIDKTVKSRLGIQEKPPLDQIIKHCENVCKSLKQKLNRNEVTGEYVKNQMEKFYEFFQKCNSQDVITRLQIIPFIHLPDENDLVIVRSVILGHFQEIKPHLYRAPTYYGKYFDLFQRVGCTPNAMFVHYASVLQNIKSTCGDNVLAPTERSVVKRAFNGLLTIDTHTDTSMEEVRFVFLPTESMKLKNSKEVTILNKFLFEIRLRKLKLDYCAGGKFLENQGISLEDVFVKWPPHLRPPLLTEVVQEELCLERQGACGMTNSLNASKIKAFFQSNELLTALCSFLKHQYTSAVPVRNFDGEHIENKIKAKLQNVTIIEYPGLRTLLKYRGNIVSGSEKGIDHYIRKDGDTISFYFDINRRTGQLDIPKILHGMIDLLRMCASDLDAKSIVHVTLLILSLERPREIPAILENLQIKQYGSKHATNIEYFPKPGTYVESNFIPFLVQGILPFKEHEYDNVAMELEDKLLDRDDETEDNPVFIYVKILREDRRTVSDRSGEQNDLERIYIVETGNANIPFERVPIYRLYRFVRRDTEFGQKLEIYNEENNANPIPVDEQCNRIREQLIQAWRLPEVDRKRIVKRLLLQWHPDKNRGNEEYCTEVFKYIKAILCKLESGEIPTDNVREEMSRQRNFSTSSTFYENVFKRARTYAGAYYDNFDSYNRSERTGNYTHSSSTVSKRPDHNEAQRWFRQAKTDYRVAMEMFPSAETIPAFNWVCFICHQSCEKALKATYYSRNANKVPSGIRLSNLAQTEEMQKQADRLESRLGEHGRLSYPDPVMRPRIPSDIISKADAEFSLDVTRTILELVEEFLN